MSLFDPNAPSSEEAAALVTTRTLVSQSASFRELVEAADATAALARIFLGPSPPPFDGESYSVEEQQALFGFALLHPQIEEDSLLVSRSRAVGCVPEQEGLFRLHVRRLVRAAEYADDDGRADAWLFFADRTAAMCAEMVTAAELALNCQQIKRRRGPVYNPEADFSSQGIYVWADFLVSWGGSERNE